MNPLTAYRAIVKTNNLIPEINRRILDKAKGLLDDEDLEMLKYVFDAGMEVLLIQSFP